MLPCLSLKKQNRYIWFIYFLTDATNNHKLSKILFSHSCGGQKPQTSTIKCHQSWTSSLDFREELFVDFSSYGASSSILCLVTSLQSLPPFSHHLLLCLFVSPLSVSNFPLPLLQKGSYDYCPKGKSRISYLKILNSICKILFFPYWVTITVSNS